MIKTGFVYFEARIHIRIRVVLSNMQHQGVDHFIWRNGEIMSQLDLRVS